MAAKDEKLAKPKLLLIDDEPALADFLANAAKIAGFEPAIAVNEADFRARFADDAPAIVALDLGMPTDGVEFLRFLSEQQFGGPVLIISGFDRRILDSAFRLGGVLGLNMIGPIEKPARLEALEALLREHRPVEVE
jgi:DNA-binding response OmpR family regulator